MTQPTFDQLYHCLGRNGPGFARGPRGGEYSAVAHARASGERIIKATVKNGGYVYVCQACYGQPTTCSGTRAGGLYNNPPYSLYDWYASHCTN